MVKEDYVSFEIAKLLKEKGFNEECRARYDSNGALHYEKYPIEASSAEMHNSILCPTHQMTIKWLREKSIIIVIQPEYFNSESKCTIWCCDIWCDDNYEKIQGDFSSYEEAVEAAIKYCLENLI